MSKRVIRPGWLLAGLLLAAFSTAADCPQGNVITIMTSSMPSFKDALPLDFSSLKASGAQLSKNGRELRVCLANEVFPIAAMANSFVLPLTKKGQFILQLNFSNGVDAVTPGKYDPAAGYGKPFWVFAEVKVLVGEKGTIASLGARTGTAEIIKMTEAMVCGRFHLQSKTGETVNSEVAGEFNVKLTK
jgi:hypothetical protein